MGRKSTFQKAAVTAFKIAGDIVRNATYVEVVDDGFDVATKKEIPIQIIYDKFTEEEAGSLSFSSLIQISDKKGLIPFITVPVILHTQNRIVGDDGEIYTIIAKDLDAADALYILLLRKV